MRKDAGVVDRGGLENRCALAGTQGSNPCLSATHGLYKSPQNLKTSDCQTVLRFFHALTAVSPASHLPLKWGQAEMAVHMLNLAVRSVKFLGVEFDQSEYEEVSVPNPAHL